MAMAADTQCRILIGKTQLHQLNAFTDNLRLHLHPKHVQAFKATGKKSEQTWPTQSRPTHRV